MKNVTTSLFALATALIASTSYAGFECQSLKRGPDHGTTIIERENGTADVISQSIMGPRKTATLECESLENNGNPNVPHDVVFCHEDKVNGLNFRITIGGIGGIQAYSYRDTTLSRPQYFRCKL